MYVIIYENTETHEKKTAVVEMGVAPLEAKWELQFDILWHIYGSCNNAVQKGMDEHIIAENTFEAYQRSFEFSGELDRLFQRDELGRVILGWTDFSGTIWDEFITKLHPEWQVTMVHPDVYVSYRHATDGQSEYFSRIPHEEVMALDLLERGATILLDGHWFKTEPFSSGDDYVGEDANHHIAYGIVYEEPWLEPITNSPIPRNHRNTSHEGVQEILSTIDQLKARKEKKNV